MDPQPWFEWKQFWEKKIHCGEKRDEKFEVKLFSTMHNLFALLLRLFLFLCHVLKHPAPLLPPPPGAVTAEPEDYLCTSLNIGDLSPDDPLWIIKFSALVQGKEEKIWAKTILGSQKTSSLCLPVLVFCWQSCFFLISIGGGGGGHAFIVYKKKIFLK